MRHQRRTFLVFEDGDGIAREWTYEQFGCAVDVVADRLVQAGLEPGAAVHVCLRNCPMFVAVWLAVAKLGAWFVPVDPTSGARDIARQVARTGARVGVCAETRAAAYTDGVAGVDLGMIVVREAGDDLEPGSSCSEAPSTSPHTRVTPTAEDRLAVMFTSGTTSEPKGVVLTQANYAEVAVTMASAARLGPEHRWLVTLPLFHANAQYYCLAPAIAVGASVAVTEVFSATRWLQSARTLRASHASLFAAPIRMILARTPERTPPCQLKHVWFAQNLGPTHYEQFSALVGCRPRQLYGMTETVAIVTMDVTEPATHDRIGSPAGQRAVRVIDPVTHREVPAGQIGMIAVAGERGTDLFESYLDDAPLTEAAFLTEGSRTWFLTGDLAAVAGDDGALRFVGRVDDVIKVAGENVSLAEVEAIIAQAPGVLEAAVVSREDALRDRVPIAYVVGRDHANPPAPAALEAWAQSELSKAARPREWHVIDELPRTSVGKVRRFKLQSVGSEIGDLT